MKVGYIRLTLPGGERVLEHRWVWEQSNGPITKGGIIHHKNGVKTDNRLANLELVENLAAHNAEHGGSLKWGKGKPLCPRGHLKEGWTRFGKGDRKLRYCLVCNRERARART